MKYIKIQKFWTLSNTDRIIAYLYSREGGYITSRELERVCNIPAGDISSYIKWLLFKGVVKRKKSTLQTRIHYFYTFNKLPIKKSHIKEEVAEEEFNIAMTGFQSECPIIKKTKKVYGKSGYLYSYAPIESILHQVKPTMVKYNFSYSIQSLTEEKYVEATCVVYHIHGHSRRTPFGVPIDVMK